MTNGQSPGARPRVLRAGQTGSPRTRCRTRRTACRQAWASRIQLAPAGVPSPVCPLCVSFDANSQWQGCTRPSWVCCTSWRFCLCQPPRTLHRRAAPPPRDWRPRHLGRAAWARMCCASAAAFAAWREAQEGQGRGARPSARLAAAPNRAAYRVGARAWRAATQAAPSRAPGQGVTS